jgi:hypothetical protein
VSRRETTYLKFDLATAVPGGTPAPAVQRALLQLFIGEVGAPGRLDVSAIQDAWSEDAIDASNAPAASFLVATRSPVLCLIHIGPLGDAESA